MIWCLCLFADGDLVSVADQLGQIWAIGMKGDAAHGYVIAVGFSAFGQGDIKDSRRRFCIGELLLAEVFACATALRANPHHDGSSLRQIILSERHNETGRSKVREIRERGRDWETRTEKGRVQECESAKV